MADLTFEQRKIIVEALRDWPRQATPRELLERLDALAKALLATVGVY